MPPGMRTPGPLCLAGTATQEAVLESMLSWSSDCFFSPVRQDSVRGRSPHIALSNLPEYIPKSWPTSSSQEGEQTDQMEAH